jgi:sodium/bile acid cotransporter 7
MIVFLNVAFYLFFTILCFASVRIPYHQFLTAPTDSSSRWYRYFYRIITPFYFNRKDTVAVMLCGAAKTVALGIPLIQSQYGTGNPLIGRVSIPLVLYQGEQILTAQFLIPLFKWWIANEPDEKNDCMEANVSQTEKDNTNEKTVNQ